MKLPYEDESAALVKAALGESFTTMGELLASGLALLTPPGLTITKGKGIDGTVVAVSVALYVKACKTYRAIILVSQTGLAEDAFVLSRALFETVLAVLWILRKSCRRRAQMYAAHVSMRDKKIFKDWKKTKGIKRYVTAAMLRELDKQIAESQKILKPEYLKGLDDTYSGKSIKETARTVGLDKVYQIFYRHACSFSHSSDITSHLTFDEATGIPVLQLTPLPSDNLRRVMAMSYALYRALVQRIDEKFGLGHEADIAALPTDIP